MRRWLMKHLIQDVPEEFSVCEYDCRKDACPFSNVTQCELRQQVLQGRDYVARSSNLEVGRQPQIKWQPVWLYEVGPFVYLLAGFACAYFSDSLIGYGAGALLMIAAILIWAMRLKYRAGNVMPPDGTRFSRRPDR